ncbi:uncharacterized protein [Argopecten irradians]|uniref:uncharacterized protein n=1 Tax=Argopecten irradians TaxID=31199 RepID=UPI00371C7CCC
MTNILRRKGLHVRRDMVMKAMREVDPDGIELRRRRRIERRVYTSIGPNHTWHVDGYDKMKPFGFAIHGCIDGYSRKVMWLTVGPSNNDPRIVATNFVLCVNRFKGCPMVLQTDPGTENVIMGGIQCVFRHDADDCFSGIDSFRVSRSVFNQRIEAWWSLLRRRQTHSWIAMLKDLESMGNFHRGNVNEMYSLRYCLMPLIQSELDNIRDEWNSHHVSYSRQASCPNGRPDVLYTLFEDTGGKQCIQPVNEDDVEWAISECRFPSRSGSLEFDNFAINSFEENNEHDAFTWNEAVNNYNSLRNRIGVI